MKYRIVAERVFCHRRYELRYFPQALIRRWFWPYPKWTNILAGEGHTYSEQKAEADCKEHSEVGVRKEFEL